MRKTVALGLLLALTALPLLSGCGPKQSAQGADALGQTGAALAMDYAGRHPVRAAYSKEEEAAAADIQKRLEDMGYAVEVQPVQGSGGTSRNLIVKKPGRGFTLDPKDAVDVAGAPDPSMPRGDFDRLLVLAAPYGTSLPAGEAKAGPDYDGISDNASGVAALLLLAQELKSLDLAFQVQLVFLGASNDDYRGARTYLDSLTEADRKMLEAFVSLDSLYAGDKLYANAGSRAASRETRLTLRRPLYNLLDVSVSYYTGERLLTNQGGFPVRDPVSGETVIYRDFTLRPGDYTPFDEAGLPVIAISSGDYGVESLDAYRDSKNPKFSDTNGLVAGTGHDSLALLKEVLPEGQLQERINSIVYWLRIYLKNGLYYANERGK